MQKKVLYVEELSEEGISPSLLKNQSLDANSCHKSLISKKECEQTEESSPSHLNNADSYPLCSTPINSKKENVINSKVSPVTSGSHLQKPQIPVFQLQLDELDQEDERQKELYNEVENTKNLSKIRVRPIEELCRPELQDSTCADLKKAHNLSSNSHKKFIQDCQNHSSPMITHDFTYNKHNTRSSSSSFVYDNVPNPTCNLLINGRVPLYISPQTPNIAILQLTIPNSNSSQAFIQKNKYNRSSTLSNIPYTKEPMKSSVFKNVNSLGNINNLENDLSDIEYPVINVNNSFSLPESHPLANFSNKDFTQTSQDDFSQYVFRNIQTHPIEKDPIRKHCFNAQKPSSSSSSSSSSPSPQNQDFLSSLIRKNFSLPFSAGLTEHSVYTPENDSYLKRGFNALNHSGRPSASIPNVEKVKTISVEDWLNIQD